ncbi:MAG: hypothetical protein HY657_06900 [Acidobacteria bacterium]|nr:hypothetical protein [Acidobacteriota bacterium]
MPLVLGAVVGALLAAAPARAGELRDFEHHVRTTDLYLRELIRDAVDTSPTFRALVARLQRSDVIVYVSREGTLPSVDGQLTFRVASGGVRYLAIRLAWNRTPRRHVASLAHELQHAVEIADAPWVVDEATLEREYARMGDHGPEYGTVKTFETKAAIQAGRQAWRDYGSEAE